MTDLDLYSRRLEHIRSYVDGRLPSRDHFHAGFIAGQFEKVFSGACPAAMFSVPLDARQLREFIVDNAGYYELKASGNHYEIVTAPSEREIWVWRYAAPEIQIMVQRQRELMTAGDTMAAHAIRAALCGIPVGRVDLAWGASG